MSDDIEAWVELDVAYRPTPQRFLPLSPTSPDANFRLAWTSRGFVPVPQTSSNWRGK